MLATYVSLSLSTQQMPSFDRIKTIQMQPISLFKYQGKCSVTTLHLCMHVQTGVTLVTECDNALPGDRHGQSRRVQHRDVACARVLHLPKGGSVVG